MTKRVQPADSSSLSPADKAKRAAAEKALDFVESGMTLGLGTGSTAAWFVRLLSERIRDTDLAVTGVATSNTTMWLARELGVPLREIDACGTIDLTVDGADEFDVGLNLIKGGGAALLQEKIVATSSERMVVIADRGKQVQHLGAFPLPVEVVKFGNGRTKTAIEEALEGADVDGREVILRETSDHALVTDGGHYILDLHLKRIGDPADLANRLSHIPGVVDHGLFIGIADAVIVGEESGECELIERSKILDLAEQMRNEDA
ncbi:ribose-5-phosphate isomerase RpiA [Amaricoccus macauensis]|uniref:ribose-5-phosphate isomerase RpiA n=1 Tax=Amaricoccus macauensis TaxID=57001 RepID=UPI003C7A69BF